MKQGRAYGGLLHPPATARGKVVWNRSGTNPLMLTLDVSGVRIRILPATQDNETHTSNTSTRRTSVLTTPPQHRFYAKPHDVDFLFLRILALMTPLLRSFHELFFNFIGLLPQYLPFISVIAFTQSVPSSTLTNPNPFDFWLRLSRMMRAIAKLLYLNERASTTQSGT